MTREEAERRAWEKAGDLLINSPLEDDEWHIERERLALSILDTMTQPSPGTESTLAKGYSIMTTPIKAFKNSPPVELFHVDQKCNVQPWDSAAGHYTHCHDMTDSQREQVLDEAQRQGRPASLGAWDRFLTPGGMA